MGNLWSFLFWWLTMRSSCVFRVRGEHTRWNIIPSIFMLVFSLMALLCLEIDNFNRFWKTFPAFLDVSEFGLLCKFSAVDAGVIKHRKAAPTTFPRKVNRFPWWRVENKFQGRSGASLDPLNFPELFLMKPFSRFLVAECPKIGHHRAMVPAK